MGTHPIFESDFDCLTDMFRKRLLSLFSASSRRLGVSENKSSNWASIHEARSMLIKNMTGEPTAANMNATSGNGICDGSKTKLQLGSFS